MQDVTKGVVKTYTGPTVINPTAQERPVVFDAGHRTRSCRARSRRRCKQSRSRPRATTSSSRIRAKDDHPARAACIRAPDLEIGRTINIPGPATFALWPGQVVEARRRATTCARTSTCSCASTTRTRRARTGARRSIKPAVGRASTPRRPPPDLTVGKLLDHPRHRRVVLHPADRHRGHAGRARALRARGADARAPRVRDPRRRERQEALRASARRSCSRCRPSDSSRRARRGASRSSARSS